MPGAGERQVFEPKLIPGPSHVAVEAQRQKVRTYKP